LATKANHRNYAPLWSYIKQVCVKKPSKSS
jgi:hypothetical protein